MQFYTVFKNFFNKTHLKVLWIMRQMLNIIPNKEVGIVYWWRRWTRAQRILSHSVLILRAWAFLSTTSDACLHKGVSRLHPSLNLSESLPSGSFVMQCFPSLIQRRLWLYLRPFNLTYLTLVTNEGREVGKKARSPNSSVFPNPLHYA